MKRQYLRILMGLIFALAVGLRAEAQVNPQIKVTLPFAFMIDGRTLPAGTYTVGRIADDKVSGLQLRSDKTGASVFVHILSIDSAQASKPSLVFDRVGELNFLTKIEISGDIYSIPVTRTESLNREARSVDQMASSAGSGN